MRLILGSLACILLVAPGVWCGAIDWGVYHRTDQILDFFKTAARKHPGTVRYEETRDPESRFILPLVTITDFSSGESGKEIILLVAGEHSRELITSEIVYWLGALLTGQTGEDFHEWAATQPIQATAWRNGFTKGTLDEWGKKLLKRVVFKLFPVENISGRKAVESGNTCLRKTISGVDLNRNWPYAWQLGAEGTEEYGGFEPFSEPESRIIKLAAQIIRPQAYVNLHSGEFAMYVPWDSKREVAPDLPADTSELLEKMNVYCECMKGAAGDVAGYLAMGTSMDWMYAELHVPYSLTFEVYGPHGLGKLANGGHPRRLQDDLEPHKAVVEEKVQDVSCVDAFNPTTKEDYEATVASWVGSLLVLAQHLVTHPHASSASHDALQQQLPEPQSPPTKQELSRHGEQAVKSGHDDAVLRGFPVQTLAAGQTMQEKRQQLPIPTPKAVAKGTAPSDNSVAAVLHNVGLIVMAAFFGAGLIAIAARLASNRRQADQARRFRSFKADV